jgi:hypothetical protein
MTYTQSQQEIFVKQQRQLLSGRRNATRRSATNSIVSCLGYYGEAFPTQSYLANKAHVVRETICRSLKTINGSIIVKINRGYKKTCRYWLTQEFLNNRHHFYDLIPALRQINLILLFSISSNVYSQNVTQIKELTGAKPRWGVSVLQYRNDEHSGYHFFEKDYGKKSIIPLFLKNKSITTTTTTREPSKVVVVNKKDKVMISEVSRNFIIRSQNSPNAKQALENPEIKAALFTPLMQEIQQSLKWEESEALMLAAIPTDALAHTWAIAKRILDGSFKLTTPIDDSFNWFVGVSAKKCKELELMIDRRFYQALCTIKGIEPVIPGQNPKPLRQGSKPRNPQGHSPAKHEPKMTDNERIGFLVKEIAGFKEKIANPEKYFLPKVNIEEALEVGKALLASYEKELADLLNPPVKIIDKSEEQMTPEEWLIWNRQHKIQRLKEQNESQKQNENAAEI